MSRVWSGRSCMKLDGPKVSLRTLTSSFDKVTNDVSRCCMRPKIKLHFYGSVFVALWHRVKIFHELKIFFGPKDNFVDRIFRKGLFLGQKFDSLNRLLSYSQTVWSDIPNHFYVPKCIIFNISIYVSNIQILFPNAFICFLYPVYERGFDTRWSKLFTFVSQTVCFIFILHQHQCDWSIS